MRRLLLLLAALGCASRLTAADPFVFKDGDRVVFLGSTLIDREQKSGYWELALTLKNADKTVTFRNLGWSGDTVWGEARNGFDQSPKGFERMVALTKELKPTVIVICYGHNESFESKAGVAKFTAGLEKLIDALWPIKSRIVLMSPTPFEESSPFLVAASAKKQNADLDLYRETTRDVAQAKKVEFYDLFERIERVGGIGFQTQNGLHLSESGYFVTASLFAPSSPSRMWDAFRSVGKKPDGEKVNALRLKIIEKNQLFFHRWRPQNETYLYLFRKHEQGNNAVEIPQFDPLIEKAEKEIAELKKAVK